MTDTERSSRRFNASVFRLPPDSRTVGRVMTAVGVIGIVAALGGVVVGTQLVGQIGTSVRQSLSLTSDTLRTVDNSLEVAEETLALVAEGMGQAEGTAGSIVSTLEEGEVALESIAELTGSDVADSLAAVQDSMPALIQVASAVDRSLSTLSGLPFGPTYEPRRSFDDSLRSLEQSIDGLPEQLREQAMLIDEASANLDEVGQRASGIADTLGRLDQQLTEAVGLLQGYSATATQARELVTETEQRLARQVTLARIMVVILGLTIALGQIVPLYFGRLLRRGEEVPITPVPEATTRRR